MNNIADIRRANLRALLVDKDWSQSDLARKIGTGRAFIGNLLCRNFGERAARSMEAKLNLPMGYFDDPQRSQKQVVSWSSPDDLSSNDYAMVPQTSIRLSAGGGCVPGQDEGAPPLAFRKEWLTSKHVSSKNNLRIAKVHGESMQPYLMDGDVVMLDVGQVRVIDGEVYGIVHADEIKVKRLLRKVNGGLIIRSDNPAFSDETLTPDESSQLIVLGRVLWRSG